MMLAKRIKRRMLTHQEELDGLKTRKERLRFIRSLANSDLLNHSYDADVRKVKPANSTCLPTSVSYVTV